MKPLIASVQGICVVPFERATTTRLTLVSQRDAFADTRLDWHPDRGEPVPQEYTLRLTRAVSLGGIVTDESGNPISGAKVFFLNNPDPGSELAIESHNFNWPFEVRSTTDARGQWRMNRVSQESLRTLMVSVSDTVHLGGGFETDNTDVQKQLLGGSYETRLATAVEVSGRVVDANGQPVQNAKVGVRYFGDTKSDAKGNFHLGGCRPEKVQLTAEAAGFAPSTIRADLASNTGPFQLVLNTGKPLRLRVRNQAGLPVSGAKVSINPVPRAMPGDDTPPPSQTDFSATTDAEGSVTWAEAPDREVGFDVYAPGYARFSSAKALPDGLEHLFTLVPASTLTVSGTVINAATGQPVPAFNLIAGWPQTNPVTHEVVNRWSSRDRDWAHYNGGKFRQVWREPVISGMPDAGYVFKIVADGYAPFVTRAVGMSESNVQFDIGLQPATGTTVTVSMPDGTAAGSIEVGLVSPGAGLDLVPGGFSQHQRPIGGAIVLTDSSGHFTLNADDAISEVIAATAAGYAEKTRAELMEDPAMVLQPWGRIEGTLLVQGNPATNAALAFHLGTNDERSVFTDFGEYQAKTGAAGHFVFAQVPPGKHRLMEVIEIACTPSPTGRGWTTQLLTNVEIFPGATTTITVNCAGPSGLQ